MGSIFDIINVPLGYLFRWIYWIVGSYGWTLVLFTLITKAILLPLSIKQQKSMSKMQLIQPKLAELQKKYQYDKEKLNAETMKLYQDYKINPMSGCLPLLIQFPVLIALYNIIRNPLTYVMQFSQAEIQTIFDAITPLGFTGDIHNQIPIADFLFHHIDQARAALPDLVINPIDFTFMGLNLSQTPSWAALTPLLLIPVLAGLTTFLASWVSTKLNGTAQQSSDPNNPAGSTMKMMTYFFPFMTVFFAFSLPAGLGFYWILSNIIQIIQQFILTKYFSHKPELEEPKKEHYREREKRRKK